jgi:pimeloyl-ACP methyl ester carboxylesterase
LETFIQELELEGITAFVQDWGSLIGLNVIGTHPEWFERVVVGDGTLPNWAEGEIPFPLPDDTMKAAEEFYARISLMPAQQPEFFDKENPVKVKRENLKNLGGLEANSRQAELDRPQAIL